MDIRTVNLRRHYQRSEQLPQVKLALKCPPQNAPPAFNEKSCSTPLANIPSLFPTRSPYAHDFTLSA